MDPFPTNTEFCGDNKFRGPVEDACWDLILDFESITYTFFPKMRTLRQKKYPYFFFNHRYVYFRKIKPFLRNI